MGDAGPAEAGEEENECEGSEWRGGIADDARAEEGEGEETAATASGGEKREGIANGDRECAADTTGLLFHLSKPGGGRDDADADEEAVGDATGLTAVLT